MLPVEVFLNAESIGCIGRGDRYIKLLLQVPSEAI